MNTVYNYDTPARSSVQVHHNFVHMTRWLGVKRLHDIHVNCPDFMYFYRISDVRKVVAVLARSAAIESFNPGRLTRILQRRQIFNEGPPRSIFIDCMH